MPEGCGGYCAVVIFGLGFTHVGNLVNPVKNDLISGLVGRVGQEMTRNGFHEGVRLKKGFKCRG